MLTKNFKIPVPEPPQLKPSEIVAAAGMEKLDLFAFAIEVLELTGALLSNMKLRPGGDEYVYEGSMNLVESLKESVWDFELYIDAYADKDNG